MSSTEVVTITAAISMLALLPDSAPLAAKVNPPAEPVVEVKVTAAVSFNFI